MNKMSEMVYELRKSTIMKQNQYFSPSNSKNLRNLNKYLLRCLEINLNI